MQMGGGEMVIVLVSYWSVIFSSKILSFDLCKEKTCNVNFKMKLSFWTIEFYQFNLSPLGSSHEPVDVLAQMGWSRSPASHSEAQTSVDGEAVVFVSHSRTNQLYPNPQYPPRRRGQGAVQVDLPRGHQGKHLYTHTLRLKDLGRCWVWIKLCVVFVVVYWNSQNMLTSSIYQSYWYVFLEILSYQKKH